MGRPELEEETGIEREDVPPRYVDDLEAGAEHSSLEEAQAYVANIERDIEELEEPPAPPPRPPRRTTTTTAPAGPTTTQAN